MSTLTPLLPPSAVEYVHACASVLSSLPEYPGASRDCLCQTQGKLLQLLKQATPVAPLLPKLVPAQHLTTFEGFFLYTGIQPSLLPICP